MMDDTLRENTNLVSSQQTEEKQSLVQMNTGASRNVETQYDINKKGKIVNNVAQEFLNNQVSTAVCWVVPSFLTIAGMHNMHCARAVQLSECQIMHQVITA